MIFLLCSLNKIHCVIEAEADIDGIKYTGDNKFDIFHLDENLERKITPLDVEIKIVNLDIEEESSILDVKLYLLRNGTRIEEGSYAFADKVELQLSYDCDYGEYGAGSGSIVTLTRGEGEALVTGLPGSNDDIVSCILKVEGGLYYNDTYGSNSATKEVDISGGGKLDVTVTEAVVGNELKYTVSKNRQALSRNQLPSSSSLWLSNRHCMIDRLFLPEEKHRVYFLETVNSTTMQGNYFLLDTLLSIIENKSLGEGDKGCLLRAKFKESDVISVGASTFDVTDRKVEAPFTLNKSNATLSAASKYTGKVWVFENGSGTGLRYYSPIAAYLNASNMTAATKLKASADDNAGAATLAASQAYIVFAEVNGVLHVFPM